MWRVQDRRPADPVGVPGGEMPGHDPAPIMPDHREPVIAERVGETEDIVGQSIEAVSGGSRRLLRAVVAALVGGDDPQPRRG